MGTKGLSFPNLKWAHKDLELKLQSDIIFQALKINGWFFLVQKKIWKVPLLNPMKIRNPKKTIPKPPEAKWISAWLILNRYGKRDSIKVSLRTSSILTPKVNKTDMMNGVLSSKTFFISEASKNHYWQIRDGLRNMLKKSRYVVKHLGGRRALSRFLAYLDKVKDALAGITVNAPSLSQ